MIGEKVRAQFLKDMMEHKDKVVKIEVALPEVLYLVGLIQLALRHPGNKGVAANFGQAFGESLINHAAYTPTIRQVMMAGFHHEHDVTKEPPAGGEATVAAGGPPAIGSGKPDVFGCGGAGCADPTCAYCCEDFIEPEDKPGFHEADTEEMLAIRPGPMTLLPPHPSKCQTCAAEHDPAQPHDAMSLYYQTKFWMEHRRYPTWTDAMSHCTEEMKAIAGPAIIEVLRANKIVVPEGLARYAGKGQVKR